MAERRQRATKEEAFKAKIEKNLELQKKYKEKIEELEKEEKELREALADYLDEDRKAKRLAEARANKAVQKELMKIIAESGLSMEEVKHKLKS